MIPAVEFRGLSKSFQGVRANSGIHLKVQPGSIHAIIGENGAGKSTAMKLLYGTYLPDEGEIFIEGRLWGGRSKPWSSPSDAILNGIGMIHQHFMLGGPYTVLDNILLGFEKSSPVWKWLPSSLRPINRQAIKNNLDQISQQFGIKLNWNAKVENLSVGIQQKIEIIKLLYRNAKILILDEPTAVLTPQETAELFLQLKKLCQQGKTIIIITHKLKEVMNLADRVTVFRAGKVVAEREIRETSIEELAFLMVGRKVTFQREISQKKTSDRPILEVSRLSLKGAHRSLQDLSFNIQRGEILGICGVEGNGQSELLQFLRHPKDFKNQVSGTVRLFGKEIQKLTTQQIKILGTGIIPEDRHREGLLLDRPLTENFLLGLQRRAPFCRLGRIDSQQLEEATQKAIRDYDIRPTSSQIASHALSGGNQQKLIIAREFKYSPQFLIAAQPTRGVDIGAIEFIHRQILKAKSQGMAVLLVSSELDEILALSDRILVMYEGRFVAEFSRGEATETMLGLRMGGAASHEIH